MPGTFGRVHLQLGSHLDLTTTQPTADTADTADHAGVNSFTSPSPPYTSCFFHLATAWQTCVLCCARNEHLDRRPAGPRGSRRPPQQRLPRGREKLPAMKATRGSGQGQRLPLMYQLASSMAGRLRQATRGSGQGQRLPLMYQLASSMAGRLRQATMPHPLHNPPTSKMRYKELKQLRHSSCHLPKNLYCPSSTRLARRKWTPSSAR